MIETRNMFETPAGSSAAGQKSNRRVNRNTAMVAS